jgi:hypothetical protein
MFFIIFLTVSAILQFFLAGMHYTTWLESRSLTGLIWTVALLLCGNFSLIYAFKLGEL